ncbi:MAG TPA: hypothetical protein VF278_23120 [Pirellulales bacterium]
MKRSLDVLFASLLFAAVTVFGLPLRASADEGKNAESEISEALAELSKADRAAAEAQRYCAVRTGHRLGSMGAPVKVNVAGQEVFVCCRGCSKKATANATATLDSVKKLKKIAASLAKLPAEDRQLAEAQRFCAVAGKNRLGSMGTPVKLVINGQPVFLCCGACTDKANAHPRETLAKAAELKKAK